MSFATRPPLPPKIGLYGLTYYTLVLIELCRRSGNRVAFVVDSHPERPTACGGFAADDLRNGVKAHGVPLWSLNEFRKWANRAGNIPLVAAEIQSTLDQNAADDPFLCAVAEVRAMAPNMTLWHPASLADAIPVPPTPGRFALFGAPGSGNMLAQALIADLIGRLPTTVPAEVQWVGSLSEHLFLTTANLIRSGLERLGVQKFDCTPDQFPSMVVSVTTEDGGMAAVRSVPSNRHYGLFAYHTHSTPTPRALAAFQRVHAPCIAIVRHPFETILSLASKICRPPGPVINDLNWLETMATGFSTWYDRTLAQVDQLLVMRYEDLVARDPEPVRRLAAALGVEVSEAEIAELFKRHLFRDLVQHVPGHFNRGGNDKWRQYFGRSHIELFARHGFHRIFDVLGYDGLDTVADQPTADEPEGRAFSHGVGAVDAAFVLGTDWWRLPGPIPYKIRATSLELAREVAHVMLADELTELLNAGGIGPNPPPWSIRIDWQTPPDDPYLSLTDRSDTLARVA